MRMRLKLGPSLDSAPQGQVRLRVLLLVLRDHGLQGGHHLLLYGSFSINFVRGRRLLRFGTVSDRRLW
ncbi:protein of unknown function [Nitrospira japonica]|uniref:Uncharacterized protein n=1 Tax=Nitrospira japonica TaxID=1325564 RepID=A0A1W1IB39_9BACT|nr:protein of unknown function [Nitrospira japonica]